MSNSGSSPAVERVSVSVVLPIRNEARHIDDCLAAVLNQDYDPELVEVVVVDGMSDDGTRDILQAAKEATPRIKVVDNPKRIFPTGANLGIREATGDLILILGGHALLPPSYIRECVQSLVQADVDCVGGALRSIGIGYVAEAIALAMSSRFGVGGSGFRTHGPTPVPLPTDTVPFGVFRRGVFERIGLYNEAMVRHQDYELNYRLRKSGGQILLLPWLCARYYVRSGLRALWRQYWQYGIWKGRFLCSYPQSLRARHLVPPLFVGALAVCAIASLGLRSGFWYLGGLVAAYLAFLLLASGSLALQSRWRHLPLLPIVLGSIHLCWGTGVWVGLMRGRVKCAAPRLTP